jgi:hypothetical protein
MAGISIESARPIAVGEDESVVPRLDVEVVFWNQSDSDIHGLLAVGELSLFGKLALTSAPVVKEKIGVQNQETFRLHFPFPPFVIQAIEAIRVDDVPMALAVRGQYQASARNQPLRWIGLNVHYDMKQSQKEWLDVLRKLGYTKRWVIEISRPNIEGMDVVKEHLTKADEAIQRRDYEGAVHDCRVAWDAALPLLKSLEKDIAAEIDRNSVGEEGYPSKSERIRSLRGAIHQYSQIGAHKEAYVVTPEDAILCYRLTLSAAAYLGGIISRLQRP